MLSILAQSVQESGGSFGAQEIGTIFAAVVVAIIGAFGAFKKGKADGQGEEKAKQERTITNVPLQTQEVPIWATKEDIEELKNELKDFVTKFETKIEGDREVARIALGNAHRRIDVQAEAVANLKGGVEQIGKNVNTLLDLALGKRKV